MSTIIFLMFIASNLSTFFCIVVETIWAGQAPEVLWSKIGLYLLFTHNLREHLSPGTLLESEVSKKGFSILFCIHMWVKI